MYPQTRIGTLRRMAGVTLIELLTVIGIAAILMAIAAPGY